MAFKSDKQRKAFFASRGNVKSDIQPTITFFTPSGNVRIGKQILKSNDKIKVVSKRKVGMQGDISRVRTKTFIVKKSDVLKVTN